MFISQSEGCFQQDSMSKTTWKICNVWDVFFSHSWLWLRIPLYRQNLIFSYQSMSWEFRETLWIYLTNAIFRWFFYIKQASFKLIFRWFDEALKHWSCIQKQTFLLQNPSRLKVYIIRYLIFGSIPLDSYTSCYIVRHKPKVTSRFMSPAHINSLLF